jgi:hypothetical protein
MRIAEVRRHGALRFTASRSDPFGLGLADPFGNSLADSVSFRLPSRPSLDGAPAPSGKFRSRHHDSA